MLGVNDSEVLAKGLESNTEDKTGENKKGNAEL